MTRKSKRGIANTLDKLEPGDSDPPCDMDPIAQFLSTDFEDPPMDELSDAWRAELQPNEPRH